MDSYIDFGDSLSDLYDWFDDFDFCKLDCDQWLNALDVYRTGKYDYYIDYWYETNYFNQNIEDLSSMYEEVLC